MTQDSTHHPPVNDERVPEVSVVIPTYNGRHLLEQYLPAVMQAVRPGHEIVIADDASTDGTLQWLQDLADLTLVNDTGAESLWEGSLDKHSIRVVVQAETTRFAHNSNRGVALALGEYVFLLNNDVEPTADVIDTLLSHCSDTVFAVGCLEYQSHEDDAPAGKNELWFERGRFLHRKARDFSSGETAWASGGSALFDRDKWLALGGFDTHFAPAYWEDIDLSYRAREAGWDVLFAADAVVYHQHETTNRTAIGVKRMEAVSWRNGTYFTWKHASWPQRLQCILWSPYWWIRRSLLR